VRATIAVAEMPHTAMPSIEALAIAPVQAPHPATQIWFRRFAEKMTVIAHQAIGIAPPALLDDFVPEHGQEMLPVDLVMKDRVLFVATGRDVIERAGVFEAELAGHGRGALGEGGAKSSNDPISVPRAPPHASSRSVRPPKLQLQSY
jgi:hypothetical protein